jgi:RNA polymerase sigma-70 factor (ECF subfamily)
MGSLIAIVTDRATTDEVRPADADRRDRFVAAARPALDRLYRLAGLILADTHEAEDAVQDALVLAFRGYDRLRDPGRFDAWLDRILVNGCRDRLRRRGVVRFIPLAPELDPAWA